MLLNTPVIIQYKLDLSGDEESSSFEAKLKYIAANFDA